MAQDILYGIKLVVLTEQDPTTQLAKSGGITCRVDTAEEAELDPVLSAGEEKILRDDDKVLAISRTADLLYGYNLKFKDNVFNANFASLVEGGVLTLAGQTVTGYDSPMMSAGATMKPFIMDIYVANYDGDSIKNYTKITLNNCKGKAPKMVFKKDFFAPEFEIKAREATKAGKPVKQISYVATLPAADVTLPVVTTSTPTVAGAGNVKATSSKLGVIYVTAVNTITSQTQFDALLSLNLARVGTMVAAATEITIPLTGTPVMPVATLYLYAVDIYGNISVPITITHT